MHVHDCADNSSATSLYTLFNDSLDTCPVPLPAYSLAQVNLVTLLGYCYSSGLVGPDLLYSFLTHLHARFDEADVSAMVTLLNAVRAHGVCVTV